MRFATLILTTHFVACFLGGIVGQKPPEKGIHGRVVDLFGKPIVNAEVELHLVDSDRKVTAPTDSLGHYFFDRSVKGKFEITVRAQGFRLERVQGSFFEGSPKPLDIGLIVGGHNDLPGIVIDGTVRMNGRSVKNATVGVVNIFNTNVKHVAFTDRSGRYRLEIVDPGQYVIYAFAEHAAVEATSLFVPASFPRNRITRDFVLTKPDSTQDITISQ
jgi:hypothetical protein